MKDDPLSQCTYTVQRVEAHIAQFQLSPIISKRFSLHFKMLQLPVYRDLHESVFASDLLPDKLDSVFIFHPTFNQSQGNHDRGSSKYNTHKNTWVNTQKKS